MRRGWVAVTVTMAALLGAAPAQAQYADFSPPVMDWLGPHLTTQQWCNVSWCRSREGGATKPKTAAEKAKARAEIRRKAAAERRKQRRAAAKERARLRRNAAKLTFVPSAEVTERVRADLVNNFAPGDTPEAVQLRIELDANPPMAQFGRMLAANTKWSATHAADVYAFSLIMMWLAISGTKETSAATDAAVRKTIRDSMANAREAYAASDAEQQELAERIASWTTVLIGQYNFLKANQPPGVPTPAQFREQLIGLGESRHLFGVDLSAVKLTKDGVRPR